MHYEIAFWAVLAVAVGGWALMFVCLHDFTQLLKLLGCALDLLEEADADDEDDAPF